MESNRSQPPRKPASKEMDQESCKEGQLVSYCASFRGISLSCRMVSLPWPFDELFAYNHKSIPDDKKADLLQPPKAGRRRSSSTHSRHSISELTAKMGKAMGGVRMHILFQKTNVELQLRTSADIWIEGAREDAHR